MAASRSETQAILETLAQMYPDARCALHHSTPFELLVATVLSAQCTDARVNIVTARIFPRYNRPEHFAALTVDEIGEMIRDCGLWHSKAKNIQALSRLLLERYGGEVPATREELMALPGVGRKTANVVLSNAFGVPAIAVDTHVFRVANRLGLATAKTPEETEQQLMRRIPREYWSQAHHWLIYHGRQVCHARNPRCSECPLLPYCRFGRAEQKKAGKPARTGEKVGAGKAAGRTRRPARARAQAAEEV
ncbi:MAG: endonuclease III [Symbiobacterium sp.]|uniref:endonuclease III n=1 Tax=Symbiobacterium sp. TaxID=1971213 RepID=UPI003463C07B